MKILVTGGAGFIGSHIVDALIEAKHKVTVLDVLHPQVHSSRKKAPAYLNSKATFIKGDVRDHKLMKRLISRADAIYHMAARVGVGQSMYDVEDYVDTNVRGTSILLDVLIKHKHNIKKLIIASSMSNYGEGLYELDGDIYEDVGDRNPKNLAKGIYEHICPDTKKTLGPVPTPEWKPLIPKSIYSSTKRDQEEMCLMVGKTYGIPTVAFRYFNVYGPRQSLNNPYTGVLAIFGARLLNKRPPMIFEDGKQTRDFIHVHDVADANVLALESSKSDGLVMNIGSGQARTIQDVARDLGTALETKIRPTILREFRVGDIRHCTADIKRAITVLGWAPKITWTEGIFEYAHGIRDTIAKDNTQTALAELKAHQLRYPSKR